MEFKIVEFKPQEPITFNYSELKAELADKLVKYKGTTYDDSAISLAKKDKAGLNKLRKAIEDKRKEIKNQCLEPYSQFEMQVKDIVNMIDKPILEIDSQIKTYEEKVKAEKQAEIEIYFNEAVGDLSNILKFERIFDSRWLNTTYSIKSIKEEIDESIKRVDADLEVIKGLNSEFSTELMSEYLSTFDLSAVLRRKSLLEERKEALERLEEKKRQQEAERQALNQQAKEQEQAQAEIKDNQTSTVSSGEQSSVKIQNNVPALMQLDFRIWGTSEQIMSLKAFLKERNIKYGKVPKEEI
jgi:hypothetical protein